MSQSVFLILHSLIAVLVTACILLQAKGAGFGAAWSGGGETFHTRRGMEKVVFRATIVLIILFGLTSIGISLLYS